MLRRLVWVLAWSLGSGVLETRAADSPLVQRPWVEIRSAHFRIFSCAASKDIYGLAAHLEQFREAFSQMAGAQAVSSAPTPVLAFPDHESMKPFAPLYRGKPGNVAGFFIRNGEETMIVLALPSTNSAFNGMEVIFHEYTHLVFRRYTQVWPLWLTEGIADVYSTFDSSGFTFRIAKPIEPYLQLLAHRSLLPLHELFAVERDSPLYNESERQGVFYAQSWLLTHYLISGGAAGYKSRFEQFTRLMREGQAPEQAFTNALRTSLPAMEAALDAYLERGENLTALQWAVPVNLASPKLTTTRELKPVEVYFWLGKELLCLNRLDEARTYFSDAQKLAPAGPLPYEGLGLLAAERNEHSNAVANLKIALQRGSTSYMAHYVYAREKHRLTEDGENRYHRLPENQAAEIRKEFEQAIALMPNFGPAYQSLGFLELVQGDDLAAAEKHLQQAIQLEPDNLSYLLALASAQWSRGKADVARRTLQPLLLPGADKKLRAAADELLKEFNQPKRGR